MLLMCPWKWTLSGRRRWQTQLLNRTITAFGCGGCRDWLGLGHWVSIADWTWAWAIGLGQKPNPVWLFNSIFSSFLYSRSASLFSISRFLHLLNSVSFFFFLGREQRTRAGMGTALRWHGRTATALASTMGAAERKDSSGEGGTRQWAGSFWIGDGSLGGWDSRRRGQSRTRVLLKRTGSVPAVDWARRNRDAGEAGTATGLWNCRRRRWVLEQRQMGTWPAAMPTMEFETPAKDFGTPAKDWAFICGRETFGSSHGSTAWVLIGLPGLLRWYLQKKRKTNKFR